MPLAFTQEDFLVLFIFKHCKLCEFRKTLSVKNYNLKIHHFNLSRLHFYPQIPNVGIVLTDAVSNRDKERTIPEAELAHEREINMFTVGFTSKYFIIAIVTVLQNKRSFT